eukprot:1145378-Pelagomonas_calceolata.AAC.3
MDLGGLRMCFNFRELDKGAFFVGSADGELVYAEFVRPEGEDNPEYTKSCVQARPKVEIGRHERCCVLRVCTLHITAWECFKPQGKGGPVEKKKITTFRQRKLSLRKLRKKMHGLKIAAHVAPIMALERSPFFDDIILTVGDWSFQIWREGHASPLFTSGYAAEMYTCGTCCSAAKLHTFGTFCYAAEEGACITLTLVGGQGSQGSYGSWVVERLRYNIVLNKFFKDLALILGCSSRLNIHCSAMCPAGFSA